MDTVYRSYDSQVVADNGDVCTAEIMEKANGVCCELDRVAETALKGYWELSSNIRDLSLDSTDERIAALKKLGQFAIALESLCKAKGAFNTARSLDQDN